MDADRAPAEHESWKSRAWPGLRNILASWKIPFRGGLQVILRRLCMWTILVIRVVISIFFIAFQTLGIHIVSTAVGVILLVMNFFFMLWCLATIDRAEGFRNVLCLRVGRTHLDVFLAVCAVLHIVVIAGYNHFIAGVVSHILWFVLWVLIAVYGFICSMEPDSIA